MKSASPGQDLGRASLVDERQDLGRASREVPQPGRKSADVSGLQWTDNKS
jgi:hypothetical protein